jgi:hypothetical protein
VAKYERLVVERRWAVPFAVAGCAYAVVASFTRPFTWAANIVTAIPLAVAIVVVVRSIRAARRAELNASALPVGPSAPRWRRTGLVWVVPTLAIVGWELYSYASLPRVMHPTVSSLLDIADATRVGKTVVFAAWLALGWFLVTT